MAFHFSKHTLGWKRQKKHIRQKKLGKAAEKTPSINSTKGRVVAHVRQTDMISYLHPMSPHKRCVHGWLGRGLTIASLTRDLFDFIGSSFIFYRPIYQRKAWPRCFMPCSLISSCASLIRWWGIWLFLFFLMSAFSLNIRRLLRHKHKSEWSSGMLS